MIRKEPPNAARSVSGTKNRRKQADSSLTNVLAYSVHLVEDAAGYSALAPEHQAAHLLKAEAAVRKLQHQVAEYVDGSGGPGSDIADALRVLFRPGAHQAGGSKLLERTLFPKEMAWFRHIVQAGDQKLLTQLVAQIDKSRDQQDKLQLLKGQLTQLATHAIDPHFAQKVQGHIQSAFATQVDLLSKNDPKMRSVSAPAQKIRQRIPTPTARLAPPAIRKAAKEAVPPLPPKPDLPLVASVKADRLSAAASVASSASSFFSLETEFLRGDKLPIPDLGVRVRNGVQRAVYSQLTTPDLSWLLLITNTVFSGGFGKVRWGLDEDNEEFAIKEFRAFENELPPRSQMSARQIAQSNKKTNLIRDIQVVAEAHLTQHLRQAIEDYCKAYDNPSRSAQNSLSPLRSEVHPFEVYDIIEMEPQDNIKKMHMIMSRESGDLFTVVANLPESLRSALALSIAAQLFTELAGLHDSAKYAHFDIKFENIFFHHGGQFKLMDFGLSMDIGEGGQAMVEAMHGSFFAPEFFTGKNPKLVEPRALTSALDVWALALTVFHAAAGPTPNPFTFVQAGLNPNQQWRLAQRVHQDFVQFRESLVNEKGEIDVAAIKPGTLMGDFFSPLAVKNPALCKLLMEHALALEPDRRAPARDLAPVIRHLAGQPNAPDFAGLRTALKTLADSDQDMAGLKWAAAELARRSGI